MLYARDHNIDHVSTFKKNGEKKKGKERKKKRKSKEGEADSLLWCLHAPRSVFGLRVVLSKQTRKKGKRGKLGGNESSHKL